MKFLYKKLILISLTFSISFFFRTGNKVNAQNHTSPHLTSFVDPYIGSGGHGHVFVGTMYPLELFNFK